MKTRKYKKAPLDRNQYKQFIDDICSENCSEGNDCVLKSFLLSAHYSHRLLMQMKCTHKFKEVLAKEQDCAKEDIEMTEAAGEWVKRGYATRFSKVYKEETSYIKLYKKVMDD